MVFSSVVSAVSIVQMAEFFDERGKTGPLSYR